MDKLTYLSWQFLPDGNWVRRELAGPPSFNEWWSSFRVMRTIFTLLDVVDAAVLENYGDFIREIVLLYGDAVWFLVYQADRNMRREHFERLRRLVEQRHADSVMLGGSSFDPAKPWKTVFRMALADAEWWNENMHRHISLYLTRIKSAEQLTRDDTAQPSLDAPGAHTAIGNGHSLPGPGRGKRPRDSAVPLSADAGKTRGGRPYCQNTNAGRCNQGDSCPLGAHICSICRIGGHTAVDSQRGGGCDAVKSANRSAKEQRGKAGGGKGGDRGGGKGGKNGDKKKKKKKKW